MSRQKQIEQFKRGRTFTLASHEPIIRDFICNACNGKGKKSYQVKDNNGNKYNVGTTCLVKHCGIPLQDN